MTTTAVFAEILVVGLEAEAWLAVLILAIFGTEWVDIGAVDQWTALLTILVLAAAYVLGIMVDRLADTLVPPKKRGHEDDDDGRPGFQDKRLLILHKSGGDGMAKFLDYQRSRMRVARGTVFNIALAIPAVVWFLWARTEAAPAWIIGAGAVGMLMLALAFYTNERINHAYAENLEAAFRIVERA